MTEKAEVLVAELRDSIYNQVVGHRQGMAFATLSHDRFVGDELIKEVSRLVGMIRGDADKEALTEQIKLVYGKIMVAHATEILGEKSADEACDKLHSIKELLLK